MNYIVFDTETTGLPANKLNWRNDYMEFPHIVQIAWKNGNMKEVESHIIKPQGWTIPAESEKIHGVSTEKAMKEGEEFLFAINRFFTALGDDEKQLIGHNVHFDTSIISANILRDLDNKKEVPAAIKLLEYGLLKDRRICTMLKTIKYCNIKQPESNRVKFPTLIELYSKLFSESFPAHDAGEDVKATERCYLRLIELGIIN